MDPITIIIGIIAAIGSIASVFVNRSEQRQANKDVMEFNSQEAEKSRNWQEEQYKKYESVAAQMQQRQQAGLNPNEGITSMSVGSGSTASSSANQISSLPTDFSMLSQLPGLALQSKQTKLQNNLLYQQIEGTKLDNETKTLNNIKLAVEANDYASYYQLVKEGLSKGNQLTDNQIQESFERARAQQLDNDEREEFQTDGGNVYTDEHNELVQRVMESFNRMINDNIRLDNENQLLPFTKRLLSGQIQHYDKINVAQELDNDLEITKKIIRDNLSIDYDALPNYLKKPTLDYITAYQLNQQGLVSSDDWTTLENHYTELLSIYQVSGQNSNNPDYVSVNQSNENKKWQKEMENEAVKNTIAIADILSDIIVGLGRKK